MTHYPRWFNHLWAWLNGYFWLECPWCGQMFGGHEASEYAGFRASTGTKQVCWRHDVRL